MMALLLEIQHLATLSFGQKICGHNIPQITKEFAPAAYNNAQPVTLVGKINGI